MLIDAGQVGLYRNNQCPMKARNKRGNWMLEAMEAFKSILDEAEFPCLFAKKALKQNSIKYLFVREACLEEDLIEGATQYLSFVKNTELKNRLYSPLVIFFENSSKDDLKAEHDFSWRAIQKLHDHDAFTWPSGVAVSPDSPQFTFCFQGVQLFINISCPSHSQMRSRNLGNLVTFVVNPRENFDHVAGADTVSGLKIRDKIRSRVRQFNKGFFPHSLGFYGDAESLEWRQYQLEEPGGLYASACPLKIRSN
ncbi:YqcI/YcgG family protein [Halopseudomonas nanhaiensis]|uniref:YqcI/YcgG family protein n=1 Tax=Halopseudomonas nanhaiensis TaxID=2830842 RepID=UPI001CBCA55B|nr:YqcI/YcgG family protein [Halopseudomonas nanhaiensis]UAW99909.1 YqcI/YcgG family protein [Halopseudomonas nanhaiensis]